VSCARKGQIGPVDGFEGHAGWASGRASGGTRANPSRGRLSRRGEAPLGRGGFGLPLARRLNRFAPSRAPVAQLDRAPDYESGGQEFESLRAHPFLLASEASLEKLSATEPAGAAEWAP